MPTTLPIEIDVTSVKELLDTGADFLLLDCRQPSEYQAANIAGAQLIPMREVPSKLTELGPQEKHIVVHCHHGGRSLQVTHYLREQGFPNVQNMSGGIDAWSQIIDPKVPRY